MARASAKPARVTAMNDMTARTPERRSEKCPKCGMDAPATYHEAAEWPRECNGMWEPHNKSEKEHLHYSCYCGYDFIGPVDGGPDV